MPASALVGTSGSAAGLDRRAHVREPLKSELHRAGDQIGPVLRDIAIGHVDQLHSGQLLEEHRRQMLRRRPIRN